MPDGDVRATATGPGRVLIAEANQPTLEEVLDRAGGRSGGSVPLADAVEAVQGDRARR